MLILHLLPSQSRPVIENLLCATNRYTNEILPLMNEQGYYRFGCRNHHSWQGGLAQHSIEVLIHMLRMNKEGLPEDSIVLVALLHELGYIRGYEQHQDLGARSYFLVTQKVHVDLNAMESQAILWHMHSECEKGQIDEHFDAVLSNPLWKLLREADQYSIAHPMTGPDAMEAIQGDCLPSLLNSFNPEQFNQMYNILSPSEPKESLNLINGLLGALKNLRENNNDAPKPLKGNDIKVVKRERTKHNIGFSVNYWECASIEDIEAHRSMLLNICQCKRNAAKFLVNYIYNNKETIGVFDFLIDTRSMYQWLHNEFGLKTSESNFYKVCPRADEIDKLAYVNHK